MIYTKPQLVLIAEAESIKQDFDAALTCSLIDCLSSWNPALTHSGENIVVNPSLLFRDASEANLAQTHIGLMQFLGEQARHLDYEQDLDGLLGPSLNVEIGVKLLIGALASTSSELERALIVLHGYRITSLLPRIIGKIASYREFLASPLR